MNGMVAQMETSSELAGCQWPLPSHPQRRPHQVGDDGREKSWGICGLITLNLVPPLDGRQRRQESRSLCHRLPRSNESGGQCVQSEIIGEKDYQIFEDMSYTGKYDWQMRRRAG